MPDITITNLRIAPGLGPRTPTKLRSYPRTSFLLNDANNTAVTESSPHDGGPHFAEWTLTASGGYYTPSTAVTKPSTTDSPDNPNGARWGFAVIDQNGRFMYWVGGLESFRLDHTDTSQDAEDIRAYNLEQMPVLTTGDRAVTGNFSATGDVSVGDDLTVADDASVGGDLDVGGDASVDGAGTFGGTVTAPAFVGNGAGITGLAGATGGVSNTGSTTIGADTDTDGVGVIDLQTRNLTRARVENDGNFKLFGAARLARVAHASLPTLSESGALIEVTDNARGVWRHNGNAWMPMDYWLDVKYHFGAKGDGSTNDTAAIQACLDAAEDYHCGVFIPPGIYMVDTLTWYPRVPVRGVTYSTSVGFAAGYGSVLRSRSAVVMIQSLHTSAAIQGSGGIRDLTLDGNSLGTVGMELAGIDRFSFKNLLIQGFTTRNVWMKGCLSGHFDDCHIYSSPVGVLMNQESIGGVPIPANLITFNRCFFQNLTSLCIDFYNGAGLSLNGCDYELNGTAGDANTGCIQLSNWTTSAGAEGVGLSIDKGWAERNRGGFFLKINAPVTAARVNIDKFLCITGGIVDPHTYGVYVANGGALNVPIVTITNSHLTAAATADIHQAGVNTSVTVRSTTYDTWTNPSGGSEAADNSFPAGSFRTELHFRHPSVATAKATVQAAVSGSGVSYQITNNGRFDGTSYQRHDTALSLWNILMSQTSDMVRIGRAAAGANPATIVEYMKLTVPAAGETPLWLYDGTTGTLKRVKLGASGTGPGGSGKALYVE